MGLGGGTYYESSNDSAQSDFSVSGSRRSSIYSTDDWFLLALLLSCFRRDQDLFWVLGTVIVGSMFIPNIFDSRFLIAVFLAMGASL